MVPLPRYAEGKCCQDPGHISNFGEADYSDTIRAGIDNCARLLNQEAAKLPNSIVVDMTDAFIKQEDGLYSSMGTPIWNDPVHLTRAAYADIWASLQRIIVADSGEAGTGTKELRYTPIINNRVDRRMPGTSGTTPGWLTGTTTGNASWRPGGNKATGRRGHFRYNPY